MNERHREVLPPSVNAPLPGPLLASLLTVRHFAQESPLHRYLAKKIPLVFSEDQFEHSIFDVSKRRRGRWEAGSPPTFFFFFARH
jgi:hypothetical protein